MDGRFPFCHRIVKSTIYLKPTPVGKVLELRGKVKEMKNRKAVVTVTLSAEGEICAQSELVLVALSTSKAE